LEIKLGINPVYYFKGIPRELTGPEFLLFSTVITKVVPTPT
jgi:hypothetical protein